MRKLIIITAISALIACEPLEQGPLAGAQPQDKVCVSVRARQETKSSMQVSETAVSNINVYAYREGRLEVELYAESDEVEFELVRGAVYRIYALANCGEVHAPLEELNLISLIVNPSDMAMCFREGREITPGVSQAPLVIPLTRLFARYSLLLDKNFERCDYRITSVRVKQRAAFVRPFVAANVASATSDGDSASESDLIALNSGGEAVFYVPENCQGVLLPGNSDPWEKIPSNLPAAKRSLCTYLHIEGEWTSDGSSADLSCNLMLGADNCTDFNVVRNTSVSITLSMSDSGTIRSSWKTDMDNFDEQRALSFPSSAHVVLQDDGWTEIPMTVTPADLPYSAVLTGPDDPVMEMKKENGRVYVRGLYFGDLRPMSTLTVTSWDGKLTASLLLILDYQMGALTNYTYLRPDHPGQYGYLRLTGVSEADPVLVETDDWSTTIAGLKSEAQNVEYHLDTERQVEYYVAHNQRTVYVRKLTTGGGTSYVQMTQHHTRTRINMASAVNPGLAIDDAEVSETGNRQYYQAGSLYYDSVAPVYLLGTGGGRLDLESFKVPVELLAFKGLTASQQDRVSDFLALYDAPTISGGGVRYDYVNETIAGGNCEDVAQSGNLAKVYLYGISDFGTSNPGFTVSASLRTAGGDVLNASGTVTGKPAFPSQRYLGSYYNYSGAPGSLGSGTTAVDFTSDGAYPAPTRYGITWSIVHTSAGLSDNPFAAFSSGSTDEYSKGASMAGHTLSFAQMGSDLFPACGAFGLRGTVTNPHSGRSYTGYYTLDVVLYMPIGCSVSFKNSKMYVNFKPFFETALNDLNHDKWIECYPTELQVVSEVNSREYYLWQTHFTTLGTLSRSGVTPPDSYQSLMQTLSSDMDLYRFHFQIGSTDYTSLLLDRSASAYSGLWSWNTDGSRGYYHLVRQYDAASVAGSKYNGLENYILEAAFDCFDL